MAAFATPEWVDALDGALRAEPPPVPGPLTIANLIRGAGSDDLEYRVIVDGSGGRARLGGGDAMVHFRQDLATARAIATGELRAREALILGLLDVSGRVEALIEHHELVEWIARRAATLGPPDAG